jgi:hypothetical protein
MTVFAWHFGSFLECGWLFRVRSRIQAIWTARTKLRIAQADAPHRSWQADFEMCPDRSTRGSITRDGNNGCHEDRRRPWDRECSEVARKVHRGRKCRKSSDRLFSFKISGP